MAHDSWAELLPDSSKFEAPKMSSQVAGKKHIPFYNPLDPSKPRIWPPGYTLVMPLCAVGNIGQLACDLIISTLLAKNECQLVGRIHSPALMPVVGPNAFARNCFPTTSTEVYESKKHKLVLIQQRTSYFKQLKSIYVAELVDWIKEAQFNKVLVLTSSFAQCNPDLSQLGNFAESPIRSMTTKLFEADELWRKANIKSVPDRKSSKVIQDGVPFLPGSGLTKTLLRAFDKAFIPAAFLIDFCSEGVNIHDCYQVVALVDQLFQLNPPSESAQRPIGASDANLSESGDIQSEWVEPLSWVQA